MKYLLPVLALALTGCGSNQSVINFLSASTDAKYYYEDARVFVTRASFTEEEAAILDKEIGFLEAGKERLESYPADRIVTDLELIAYDFAELKRSYMEVRRIVIANQSEYGIREWVTLTRFDASVAALEKSFEELLEANEGNAALLTALRLADTTLKIASLL